MAFINQWSDGIKPLGASIAAIKAETDYINTGYVYMQLLPRRGNAVQGTWARENDAAATIWRSDINTDSAGFWNNKGTAAINDEYAYPLILPAGTYSIELYYYKENLSGIATILLGTTVLGTVDMYAAGNVYNTVTTIDFTVATLTAANFRLVMASKNGASGAYRCLLQLYTLWRRT